MKTLIQNATGISLWVFPDDMTLDVNNENVEVQTPDGLLVIRDCHASNCTLVRDVTPPEDWTGHKYLYDNRTWTLNPNWVDPTQG
jgi:hypothetical protein